MKNLYFDGFLWGVTIGILIQLLAPPDDYSVMQVAFPIVVVGLATWRAYRKGKKLGG